MAMYDKNKDINANASKPSNVQVNETKLEELSTNSDIECQPFEGCEKRLSIYFESNIGAKLKSHDGDANIDKIEHKYSIGNLRSISRNKWSKLLEYAKCSILNVASNKYFDAYLLSESSLFVYDRKVIIKTCGRTTLLHIIGPLLRICGACLKLSPNFVMYSRSDLMFPHDQVGIYKNFDDEVEYLNNYFFKGECSILGHDSSQRVLSFDKCHERWNVYVACNGKILKNHDNINRLIDVDWPNNDVIPLSSSTTTTIFSADVSKNGEKQAKDGLMMKSVIESKKEKEKTKSRLEVIMFDVCQESVKYYFKKFYRGENIDLKNICDSSGISDLLPNGTKTDTFLFDPCGFSLNGLLLDKYWTIHITPEAEHSFISFETNYSYGNRYRSIIDKLVQLFKPKRFSFAITSMELPTNDLNGCLQHFAFDEYQGCHQRNQKFGDAVSVSWCSYRRDERCQQFESSYQSFHSLESLQSLMPSARSVCVSVQNVLLPNYFNVSVGAAANENESDDLGLLELRCSAIKSMERAPIVRKECHQVQSAL